jgi:hypothetical protein
MSPHFLHNFITYGAKVPEPPRVVAVLNSSRPRTPSGYYTSAWTCIDRGTSTQYAFSFSPLHSIGLQALSYVKRLIGPL